MAAYNFIAKVTVGSGGAANITFSSIPQTYTDLYLVLSGRVDTTVSPGDPNYNSYLVTNAFPLTSGADTMYILGNGSTVSAATDGNNILLLGITSSAATANVFGNTTIYITDYASTSKYKQVSLDQVTENNSTSVATQLSTGIFPGNTEISSITIEPFSTGNFVQYSTAYLYGISNA